MAAFGYTMLCEQRYHPAVVAQKAATMALLSEGRFTLGVGAGENLNEHVTGGGWPPADTRHEMLADAVRAFTDAGFTHVALLQAGGEHQGPFVEWSERVLLPALRDRLG